MMRKTKKTKRVEKVPTETIIEFKAVLEESAHKAVIAENGALRLVIHEMARELAVLRIEMAVVQSSIRLAEPQVWTHSREEAPKK